MVMNMNNFHKKCSGLQALIISGGVGNKSDELISPSGNVSCLLPKSGRMHHTHDKSIICGGLPGAGKDWSISATCLNLTSSGWVETNHSLVSLQRSLMNRTHHSSWAVDGGIILMAGYDANDAYQRYRIGRYDNDTTTELVMFDGTSEEAFSLIYSETM